MNLYDHPQWLNDVLIYQNDISKFAMDAFGLKPTWQQVLFFKNIQVNGKQVSVKYGWGCDEAMIEAYAITSLHNLLFKHESCTLILTPRNGNRHLIFKNCLTNLVHKISKNSLHYLAKFIGEKNKSIFIKGLEYLANVTIKKEKYQNQATSIAGSFSENYLLIVIDAARIKESWLEVGCGSLVHADNRCVFSQKMDTNVPSKGFFYNTQHNDRWIPLTFSAAENPLHQWDDQDRIAIAAGFKSCTVDGNFY